MTSKPSLLSLPFSLILFTKNPSSSTLRTHPFTKLKRLVIFIPYKDMLDVMSGSASFHHPTRPFPWLKRLVILYHLRDEGAEPYLLCPLQFFFLPSPTPPFLPGGGTQLWVGYGGAAQSFDHLPITKPEMPRNCNLYLNHLFSEGPFFIPIGTF